jgi:diguanylate cyclase (GGDEF)-like protein
MQPLAPPRILIFSGDPATGRRWADSLRGAAAKVWSAGSELAADDDVEVLVTDLESIGAAARQTGLNLGTSAEGAAAAVGVITIEPAGWGDVCFAADGAPGELARVCTLLAEIVRLRRARAQAARAHHEIKQLAYTDPLTGLANRRAWDARLAALAGGEPSASDKLWLAIVDLDRFKEVNEAHGLLGGDRTLAAAAQAMEAALRRGDLVARLGGDEFGLLLAGLDESGARGVYQRLQAAVAGQRADLGGPPLTLSIGYAAVPGGISGAGETFAAAERALREAKRAGGNRAVRGEITPSASGR